MARDFLEAEAGRYWGPTARRMLDRIAAAPGVPLFSSRYHVLDIFGAGAYQPDAESRRRPLAIRALRAWERVVRRHFGYGRLGDALVAPFSDGERVEHLLGYARASYYAAVVAGAASVQDLLVKHDLQSPLIYDEQRVSIGGRPLAFHTIRAVRNAELVGRLAGQGDTLLEIGGGIGELARVLLRMGIVRRAVLVDIPPALAAAQEVLASDLGDDAVAFYDPARQTLPDRPVVCLMPDQLALATGASLVLNMGSFQEMPAVVVRLYLEHAHAIGADHIISVNTRHPHPINSAEGVGESFYESVLTPAYRVAARLAWPAYPGERVEPHGPDYTGYHGLLFVRA
jgi:putative sugar O-methyltransferase